MRKQPIVTGEYHHIYNRGVDKRDIFLNRKDLDRFIESISEFNQTEIIGSIRNARKNEDKTVPKALSKVSKEPLVSFATYCLNPNHFHFVLKQLVDGGIAKFMQKLQAGYTSYFNIKNSRTGSLFQGTFKSQIISNENYFNKIIGYVNKNYQIHNIPKNKVTLSIASDYEYENNNFKIVSKEEGKRILEIFNGSRNFKKHCDEIVSIVRKERGKTSLLEEEDLPDSA
ncbi:MAG: transposase [Candidatus Pacebacteria bacterium]|nr:transposase [Candidatus Paceibacterota bacterium]